MPSIRMLCMLVLVCSYTKLAWADETEVARVLDNFHNAASVADAKLYFSLLHDDSVFIGTDASERWSKNQFQDYALPYFNKGVGWTYVPVKRNISISKQGSMAWFDEILENKSLGVCRGTGVLMKGKQGWKVMQYHLTVPIPNAVIDKVVHNLETDFYSNVR